MQLKIQPTKNDFASLYVELIWKENGNHMDNLVLQQRKGKFQWKT